jgi:hypothetical protein
LNGAIVVDEAGHAYLSGNNCLHTFTVPLVISTSLSLSSGIKMLGGRRFLPLLFGRPIDSPSVGNFYIPRQISTVT